MSPVQTSWFADGSSFADAHSTVVIDRSKPAHRWRFTCPAGHTRWAPTNNHVWCKTCRQQCENGDDTDPEHYSILDQRTGDEIPWSAVELVE